ncbi:pheA operon leader peptide PheL [Budviciaceae bacterium CWB-B4]|uniref:PheA operon leader peptide PheL n=1 Tax=Limnobaculum xujianqingii TaxID=2738837 RepID=A0A9D7AKF0_9GAMM|nr:pheA operon leader peptide PheL [Limnobaculum xujianqingii]MBK5074498.1 pheA operon leader peptide PheL [Limnobaculum xujianqingii]MBK5177836.1 pheA operon leader peptide PheL [Limnobaculum xujianqingii]
MHHIPFFFAFFFNVP